MWKFIWFAISCGLVWAQTDYVPTNYEELSASTMGSFGAEDKCGEGSGKGLFQCVPYHKCDAETNTTKPETVEPDHMEPNAFNYSFLIDIRLGVRNPCSQTLHVCCKIAQESHTSPLPPSPTTEDPEVQEPTTDGTIPSPTPPAPTLNFCGIRNGNGIDFKITGNTHNEAEYGEFPWMVAVLKTNYNPSVDPVLAVCGGSLIAPRVVLTGAHCVYNKYKASDVKVRAGEWDTQTENERYPYQERDVEEIIIHERYEDKILLNDVALLILTRPFNKARHIGTICLPNQNEVINSRNCFGTGWGKNLFGQKGSPQAILKKIELPIVPKPKCEAALRETRLGALFKLHDSFTCAGGVLGKDTCTGDGGSPLVCPDPNNPTRYVQAGIVAWGIGCGTTTPGVYADVAKFRSWVDAQMKRLNLSDKTYTL